ncbi:prenyltransferase/squalene oxidase repeat-containing protein [Desulfosporosinus sp. PR]|uniref:prenyltransferase/squalene oxidase repeat-containing protein n=1 Tax=Candidatus Desulfosporosinus nitrosoreducens TaxID=3401928 RepID=UPI0027FD88D4|nr:prenyltransferase/squalene oxidase repeat-containing protein [Desulfosporosinus sp. PR]MDQ7094496.1 prenyltransferase/squalene oxidase repeat-containing protein [Desulfosporosinus sp. PR]
MELKSEVSESLVKAREYVVEGVERILAGKLDEMHGVSPSPGASALAALALLAVGRRFESSQRRGVQWLWQNRRGGWGKFPGDKPDEEITKIVNSVLQGSEGGWRAKIRLLSQARQFSEMILSLGQRVVPGLEGPTPEEIVLPNILENRVLAKLPLYGRPVVVAASLLASDSPEGIRRGIQYLLETQMPDGSWAEDIVATSLGILGIMRRGGNAERVEKAGQWLAEKQYPSGGWPAFDQLKIWAMGWAVCIFAETMKRPSDYPWLHQAAVWLKQGQNSDGSYGSTPPHTHPDLDDTSVALIALRQVGEENSEGIKLLRRLQNPEGSWGTFPSFQGTPPAVSSEFPVYIPSVDVSIHALEALWRPARSQDGAIWRGLNWILSQQDEQGAFPASWFEGGVYSTAQAVELLSKWKISWDHWTTPRTILLARRKGLEFLIKAQKGDGGWGSVVETGLALSGLWRYAKAVPGEVLDKGITNLLAAQNPDGSFKPSYRGIYAKGWNYEEPLTTALTAIRALQRYQTLQVPRRSFLKL